MTVSETMESGMADYDAIIACTGQAGPSLARRFADSGQTVAVVERNRFGGTCINTGCTPTKTMVASAYAMHVARRGADYGFASGEIKADMKRIKAWVAIDIVGGASHARRTIAQKLARTAPSARGGHGRCCGPDADRGRQRNRCGADRIFLDVGGRAAMPPIAGLDRVPYLTNSTMLDVDFLPRHLLVLGGSYIGLEFGQMFRRFGSEVTIVEAGPRLIVREDEEVSQAVAAFLAKEGITVHANAKCHSVSQRGDEIVMMLDFEGGSREVVGSHLLVATGRRPNTDDLGLDRAGIKTNPRGYIEVDDELHTNVPGVWAMGDCNGKGAFTHTSYNDFEIVAANLLDGEAARSATASPPTRFIPTRRWAVWA